MTVVASTSQKQKRKRVTRKIGKTKAASVGPDLRKGPALVEELVVQIKLRVNINCQGTSTNLLAKVAQVKLLFKHLKELLT